MLRHKAKLKGKQVDAGQPCISPLTTAMLSSSSSCLIEERPNNERQPREKPHFLLPLDPVTLGQIIFFFGKRT